MRANELLKSTETGRRGGGEEDMSMTRGNTAGEVQEGKNGRKGGRIKERQKCNYRRKEEVRGNGQKEVRARKAEANEKKVM